jgi:hypothetical protein
LSMAAFMSSMSHCCCTSFSICVIGWFFFSTENNKSKLWCPVRHKDAAGLKWQLCTSSSNYQEHHQELASNYHSMLQGGKEHQNIRA